MNNKKVLILVVGLLVVLVGLTGCSRENELLQEAKSAQKEEIIDERKVAHLQALNELEEFRESQENQIQAQSGGEWAFKTAAQPGYILLALKEFEFLNLLDPSSLAGHTAIVSASVNSLNNMIIEAANIDDGVVKDRTVADFYNYYSERNYKLSILKVTNDPSKNYAASSLASEQVGKDYELANNNTVVDMNDTDDSFYCSQLVWYVWNEQGYDLNMSFPLPTVVLPVDIQRNSQTDLVFVE